MPETAARARTSPEALLEHEWDDELDPSTNAVRVQIGGLRKKIGRDRIEANILAFYAKLMKKFLADKALIPSDSLVEVKFEDLEEDPLGQVQRVYEGLRLPGFDEAAPAVRGYMRSVEGYQKNKYEIDDDVVKSVNRHWQFALDEWGYAPREALSSPRTRP